jgi:hypothetical protein
MDIGYGPATNEENILQRRVLQNNIPGVTNPTTVYDKEKAPPPAEPTIDPFESRVLENAQGNIPGVDSEPTWTADNQGKTEAGIKAYEDLLNNSTDPEAEKNNINVIKQFAELTGKDFNFLYNNWDSVAEDAMGPGTTGDTFTETWNNARGRSTLNAELSDLYNNYRYADENERKVIDARAQEIYGEMPPEANVQGEWYEKFTKKALGGGVEQIPMWTAAGQEGLLTGLAAGATTLVAGLALNASPLAATPLDELFTFGSGFTTGFTIGSANSIREFQRGLQYKEFIDIGLEDNLAWTMADLIGASEGFLEVAQAGAVVKLASGQGGRVFNALYEKAMKKTFKDKGFNRIIKGLGAIGEGTVEQMTEEALQELSTIMGTHLALEVHNERIRWQESGGGDAVGNREEAYRRFNQSPASTDGSSGEILEHSTFSEDLNRTKDTFVESFYLMFTMSVLPTTASGVGTSVQRGIEAARLRKQEQTITENGQDRSDEVFTRTETSQTIPIENIEAREDLTPESIDQQPSVFGGQDIRTQKLIDFQLEQIEKKEQKLEDSQEKLTALEKEGITNENQRQWESLKREVGDSEFDINEHKRNIEQFETKQADRAADPRTKLDPIKVVETTPGNYRVASGNTNFVTALQGGLKAVEVEVIDSRSQAETADQSREAATEARPQYNNIVNSIAEQEGGSIKIAAGDQLTAIKADPGTATNLTSQMIFKTQAQADTAINRIRQETTSFEVNQTPQGTNIRFALDNGYIAEVNVQTEGQFTAETRISPLLDKLNTAMGGTINETLESFKTAQDITQIEQTAADLKNNPLLSDEVRSAAQAVYDEVRSSNQKVFDSLQPRVEAVTPAATEKRAFEMTPEEFEAQKTVAPAARETQRTQPKELNEEVLRELIKKEFPDWVEDETTAAVAVAEKIANYKGQDVDTWLRENLTAEVFTRESKTAQDLKQGKRKAAVSFNDDMQALIHLSDNSDLTSWIHEIGHVLRRNLTAADLALVEQEMGIDHSEWNNPDAKAEEQFVRMLEDHLKNNTHQGTIFDKIAEWFREVYFALRDNITVPENVAKLFDEIFGEEVAVAEEALFQGIDISEEELTSLNKAEQEAEKTNQDIKEFYSEIEPDNGIINEESKALVAEQIGWADDKLRRQKHIIEGLKNDKNLYVDKQGRKAIVHKASREEWNWQVSYFDERGPYSHDNANTLGEIVTRMTESGSFGEQVAEEALFQPAPGIETKAFKTWFKDSKIVNEDGSPKVVFHGSFDRLEQFDSNFAKQEGEGVFFFSESEHDAQFYARHTAAPAEAINAPGFVHDVYLSIQNPAINDFTGEGIIYSNDFMQVMINEAKDNGHDGMIIIGMEEVLGFELSEETQYVAFEPTQIKSTDNRGTFDPADPRILFQDSEEHEEIVRDAVERGQPVPDKILDIYKDRDWAQAEIAERDTTNTLEGLYEDARDVEDGHALRKQQEAFGVAPKKTMTPQELDDYYDRVWKRANRTSPEEAQKEWEESIQSDQQVESIITSFRNQRDQLVGAGISSVPIWAAINSAGPTNQKQLSIIRSTLRNDGPKYRRILAEIEGDQVAIEQLEYEDTLRLLAPEETEDQKLAKLTINSRIKLARTTEDPDLKKKILTGNVSLKAMNILDKQYVEEVRELETKIADLNEDIDDRVKASQRQTAKGKELQKNLDKAEKEVTRLDKEIETVKESKKARLTKLRTEKNEQIADLKAEMADLSKSAKAEARAGVKIAQAELKTAQKKKDDLRKLRAYKEQLAKRILKDPSAATHHHYADIIRDLQKGLDGAFRRLDGRLEKFAAAELKESDLQHFLDEDLNKDLPPEAAQIINNIKNKLEKTPLNTWTLRDLENLDTQVRELRQRGRDLLKLQKERRKGVLNNKATIMGDEVLEGDKVPTYRDMGSKLTRKARESNAWWKAATFTFIPDTFVKNTAGFQEGDFYDFWINEPNKAQDAESTEIIRRTKDRDAFLKSINFKAEDLYRKVKLPGFPEDHTVSEVIGMYAASQNPQSHAAAFYGNKLQDTFDLWLNTLTENEKLVGDWIIEEFSGDNYNRLSNAYTADTNGNLGKVDRYFPIIKKGVNRDADKDEFAAQLLAKAGRAPTTPGKKFTKTRLEKIPPEFQDPIKLDIMSLWSEQVQKQEHYISHFQWSKDAKYLMNQTGLAESIVAAHGVQVRDWYNNHIGVISNPNIYKAYGMADRIVQKLRSNLAVAALGFNMSTVLKQAPSLIYYLNNAGGMTTGSLNLMKSSLQFSSNPRKLYETIRSKDPQWADRVVNRTLEDIKTMADGNRGTAAQKKLAKASMFLIAEVDKAVTAVGWNAVYQGNLQLGEAEAVRRAQQATLTTQPAGRAKDIPVFLQNKGPLSLFTMFSNQTNKIYNIVAGDILPSVGRIAARKTPNAVKKQLIQNTIANITAVSVGAISMMIIGGWVKPDEDEEFLAAFAIEQAKQLAGILPIAGRQAQSGLSGYSSGVDPLPIVNDVAKVLKNMAEGKEISEKQVEKLLVSAGTVFGVPGTIAAARLKNVVDVTLEDSFAEGILEIFGPAFREGSIAREIPEIIEEIIE